ncbi:MAG: ABC transporter substrate-binding protein, partial [Rubrivivax sp.]|nr:ABC transporter substrate-binding protein [Rubrivivax sp.]
MKRRDTFALAAALALPAYAQQAADGRKVLHIAFPVAETNFDPAQISDLYSRTITPHIFETLYKYDHLARPVKVKPLTAVGMPEVSADFRTWTVRLQPGIFFADDPAFKGVPRELTAQDYVFALKRFADPAVKAALWSSVESLGYVGLAALRKEAQEKKAPFDYDREIEGLRALDRYTVQYVLAKPRPRFLENLAASDIFGAVAREVVQHYGDKIGEHPVGTGPFVLAQWRRSSLIVLERNPNYREVLWDAEPAAGDAAGQTMLAKLKGRRLPLVDRVEVSVIEESQPRWLTFLNGKIDVTAVPGDFINIAMPKGQVAPNLAKKGIRGVKVLLPDTGLTYFNMLDPVVGGLEPERVALRRAINLGVDIDREIRLLRRGMAIPAQSAVVPHT